MQFWDIRIISIDNNISEDTQNMQLSQSNIFPLPCMKKLRAHSGNVAWNRSGKLLREKNKLMFVKLLNLFSSEMHTKLLKRTKQKE